MCTARYTTITAVFFLILCQLAIPTKGQYGISFDIKKPKEFENRVLRSEKPQKKFTAPRRFIQNTVTHYNYFFNANNKLNEVIVRAKQAFRDDYSQLLPFYNYSLDMTAADSIQLDSVSFKAQTGIVLHDLRSDWADNLYLLWGASYYLQKQFDSAYLMFQFINYAFAKKEDDGYYLTIGSARDGNSPNSISTKEKNSLTRRIFSEPPSRNDAFIWQIRNHLAQDHYTEAASLILALKNDSLFPKRLHNDLEEVQAYYHYRLQQWDSSAAHLENALSNATNKQERARWEYLLGQLYERTGKYEQSLDYYSKSIVHTTDPILDVYARLASVRVNKDEEVNTIDKNIATLTKMARRDKYVDYRDIIYYMAAQMELERDSSDAAMALLLKSTKYRSNYPAQRNKAFLQLGDLSFARRDYRSAQSFYDSIRLDDAELKDPEAIANRKSLLVKLIGELDVVVRQDSLQRLAALPEDERKDYVKKLARKMRRERGLKEEPVSTTGSIITDRPGQAPPTNLFNDNKKGEWYFYNGGLREKGALDFKSRWGTRPNTDNWRRSASQAATVKNTISDPGKPNAVGVNNNSTGSGEISYESLYDGIPLTEEQLTRSQDSISAALFNAGQIYTQEIEDCISGTATFEDLRARFPQHKKMDQVMFNLYYCYNRGTDKVKAAQLKKEMAEKFESSNFTTIVTTGKNPQDKRSNTEATKAYENIYDLFIEGNFSEAVARKKAADSTYGNNYWTPQLLYIEALYYVKQQEDSIAKKVLGNIVSQFAGKPLAVKAATMLDVLNRRAEIEEELRNLVIVMPEEDTTNKVAIIDEPVTTRPSITRPTNTRDTSVTKPLKDTATTKPVQPPVVNVPKPTRDTAVKQPVVVQPPVAGFNFTPDAPHYVMIIMNKVDPIFVNEARNAFTRYNRNTHFNKQMQAELADIDAENRLLLLSPFKNAEEAVAYVEQTRPKTATEILPWLKGGKYSFLIITEANLQVLKNSKEIDKYKQFIDKALPGKFQ